jgi:hypothetical protein
MEASGLLHVPAALPEGALNAPPPRLDRPQSLFERCGEKENLFPCQYNLTPISCSSSPVVPEPYEKHSSEQRFAQPTKDNNNKIPHSANS